MDKQFSAQTEMKILFLDQSGKLGGAELALLDIVRPYSDCALVGLFQDGPFCQVLEQAQIPVEVLTAQTLNVRKDSGVLQSLQAIGPLIALIYRVIRLSQHYDAIYTNTPKALVVGAIASFLSRQPLIYHLHDILSKQHFSSFNLHLAVNLANQFASLIIANSQATKQALIAAGGRSDRVEVVYNGFNPDLYNVSAYIASGIRHQLGLENKFVIGHFSRLSPWKGQHILLEALTHCSDQVVAVFVGDALFGEEAYVQQLHEMVKSLRLENRVQFLGFRSDVPDLMSACDMVAHTSTAPEPFGRVIVEAMLCGTPVVAAADGGAVELVEHGQTGWQTPPGDAQKLAEIIQLCQTQPEIAAAIAQQAQPIARDRFNLNTTNQQIRELLQQLV